MNGIRQHRVLTAALAALSTSLLLPGAVSAQQRATGTLILRVEESGLPAAGVGVSVFTQRVGRQVGVTGASGLAQVDQLAIDIPKGRRVVAHVLRCPDRTVVYLVPETERIDAIPADCEHLEAGSFFWGQTERVVVSVDGGRATVQETRAEDLDEKLSGLRVTASALYTSLLGEDFDDERNGFGGDVTVFHLWKSGLGIGLGGNVTTHDVTGIDESLWKWSLYLEPRYTLYFHRSKFRPHVFGRVSHNWFAYENGARLSESGWGFGGGLGVAYPLLKWMAVDVGVYYGVLSMDTDFEGQTYTRSGSEVQIKAGARFF